MPTDMKMKDYDKDRPKILALDLDGTVLNYDGDFGHDDFGEALKGMVQELEELVRNGWVVVIWTCRNDSPKMREHLRQQGIPFSYVNDHPWNKPDGPRKIHADVYADVKALEFSGISAGFATRVMEHKPWWQSIPWGS